MGSAGAGPRAPTKPRAAPAKVHSCSAEPSKTGPFQRDKCKENRTDTRASKSDTSSRGPSGAKAVSSEAASPEAGSADIVKTGSPGNAGAASHRFGPRSGSTAGGSNAAGASRAGSPKAGPPTDNVGLAAHVPLTDTAHTTTSPMTVASDMAGTPDTHTKSTTADAIPTEDAADAAEVATRENRPTVLSPQPT